MNFSLAKCKSGLFQCAKYLIAGAILCLSAYSIRTVFQAPAAFSTMTIQVTQQTPVPSLTSASLTLAITNIPAEARDVTIKQITETAKIAGVRWSEDGQSVLYATWRDQREKMDGWWKYEIGTGNHYNVSAPLAIDLEVLTQLEASYKNEAFMWFGGGISPGGKYVVYNRLPQDHTYTPTPDELYIPPMEMWIANSDGSQARKLRPCHSIGWVLWFEQERRLIFSCGYEGAHDIGMINVDGSSYVDLTAKFNGVGVSFPIALSPDGTTLAFPDALGGLQIAALDSGEVHSVARWGQRPNWSADNRRLYYQYQEDFDAIAPDIHVYDLTSATDSIFIPATIRTRPMNAFTMSPLENAAVFEDQGLWLMTWSR